MEIRNILIGADIEVFLMHKNTKEIVSAEGLVRGTKDVPFSYDQNNPQFITMLDNVSAEFGIPPVNDRDSWIRNLSRSLEYINSTLPEELCTVAEPSVVLHDRFLQTENSRLFGCDPDYCVWTRSVNMKPECENPNLRSAGGHIHIGYNADEFPEGLKRMIDEELVKFMDLYVGVPSVIQEPDNERKLLYGRAGCFRDKNYGVEYRTVSNYYLQSEKLMSWVYNNTMKAVDMVRADHSIDGYADVIQECINTANKDLARNLINEFEIEMA